MSGILPATHPRAAADRASKPRGSTAATRQRILEAALAVFGAHGYHKGALMEVADRAGMTHAGVLHHFGTKEGLLIAMLQYRDGEAIEGIGAKNQVEGPAFFDHLVETVNDNVHRRGVVQAYTVLSAESVTDGHPAQEYFRGRISTLRNKLERTLFDLVDNDVDPREVRNAANTIIAVMDGLQVQWLLEPGAVNMPETVATLIDSMVSRLGRSTPK